MICDNYLCIYQEDNQCILKEISIDELGMCCECIYPSIDESVLKEAKLSVLKELE